MIVQTDEFRKNYFQVAVLIIAMFSVIAIMTGCSGSTNEGNNDQPSGKMVDHSGCGGFEGDAVPLDAPTNQDCVEYNYDGDGVLLLTHLNAGFNCCTDLSADIDINDNVITIVETESGDYCRCICLYDVNYSISNLPPDTYLIKFIELYLQESDDTLQFTLDLNTTLTGDTCVNRSSYPWDMVSNPTGSLTDSSMCKNYTVMKPISDTLSKKSCVQWQYNGSTLSLSHINAVLNCCPVFVADVTIDDNNITIKEIDSLFNGGCDCICCYDLEYEIQNLPLDEYTITFLEPYLFDGEDTLRYTVNLYYDPEGIYCVDRLHLPL